MKNTFSKWPLVQLDSLAKTIDYGLTTSACNKNTGTKFLRITDIQEYGVDWNSVPFCQCNEEDRKKYELASGDIVFARTGATTGKSYLIKECPSGSVFASYLIRVKPNSLINSAYLYSFFQTPEYWQQITSRSTGTAQAGVNATKLKSILLPLPPLPEQQRIAAVLSKVDSIREKRRRTISKLDSILESAFTKLFIDKTFPLATIGDLLQNGTLQLHKDGNHGSNYPRTEDFGNSGIPFLSARCITDKGFINDQLVEKLKENKANKLTIGWIEKGDILLAHNATVGKVGIYQGQYEKALIGTSLTAFRPNPQILNSNYFFGMLRSRFFQQQLEKIMGQTTRNQVPITTQRNLQVILPSIDKQFYFSRVIDNVFKLSAHHARSLNIINNLFLSLQQRAFSGELFSKSEKELEQFIEKQAEPIIKNPLEEVIEKSLEDANLTQPEQLSLFSLLE